MNRDRVRGRERGGFGEEGRIRFTTPKQQQQQGCAYVLKS